MYAPKTNPSPVEHVNIISRTFHKLALFQLTNFYLLPIQHR